ncbi:MAG: TonB-dependent receptor [Bacteroidales bacterium]|nr:TonB-dependent receptor [Bacteroidales bacterium]MBR5715775.1 TonB-dependent receptor [Bacteroidales bacterium]
MEQISRKLTEGWKMLLGILLFCFVMAVSPAYAQNTTVKGVVRDAMGPTAGATVVQKGTNNGTITDLDGNFEISVPSNAVLVISFVGLDSQEIPVAGKKFIEVTLEGNEELEEVVVVGYGTQKKSDITGSVASVDKARLSKLPVTNVLQAVQGATAGVTISQGSSIPGDAPSALVRGRNSINAGTGPYIVVDGVPISKSGGSLNDINPGDIESMEILKDASATAIYGTNGANGVILITTKHGKEGKPSISYNGYVGIEDFAHKMDFCNGAQITQRYKDYVAQNAGETMYNDYVKNQAEAAAQAAGQETDWIYDMVSRTGIIQDHNVTINGGAEKVKYFISGDYLSQKGVLKGFNYKRYSLRLNIDADVTDYLKIGTNTYIVSHNRDGGRVNFLMAEAMSPYGQVYNEDGTYCIYPMASENLFFNPMRDVNQDHERRQWNINLNGYADVDFGHIWTPLKGLHYKFNFGYSYVPKRENYYNGAEQNNLSGYGYIFNAETQNFTAENILSWARDFGKHHVDLTALYAASRKKYHDNTAAASIFINDEQLWHNLAGGVTQVAKSYTDLYTTCSQMGRINYSYDSRYLFTATVRRDGSSVFGDDNKYGVFPSVAIGWNIANEAFMESTSDWLSTLKLRLSYGKAGNEAIGVYETLAKMANAALALDGASATALYPSSRMGNSGLSWETTKSFNVGVDFGLLNNRINGNIDFYKSNTTDLLLQRNLPKISGYSNVYMNMGETANTGLEVTINSKNVSTKDFTWNTSLVWSWNKNEIKDLYGDGKDDLGNRWFIGHPISVIYDYEMEGIWQKDEIERGDHQKQDPQAQAGDVKLRDIDGDGKITPEGDKTIQGQTTPKWIAGLTNTFTYKGISLSIFIQTVQGLKRNNSLLAMASDEMGRRNSTLEVGYWSESNPTNEFRSLSKTSNRWGYGFPRDASFTRIKDITLSYQVPARITQAMHINALTIYASGRNLFTFTDWIGWDPESDITQRGWGGYENNYPMTKSMVFGLNVTF